MRPSDVVTGVSIGCDIVDPELTDPIRTGRSAFHSKILSASEHELRPPELSFHSFLWLCWSVKESAFKFLRRQHPDLTFAPVRYSVESIKAEGETYVVRVRAGNHLLHALSVVSPCIFTVLQEDPSFQRTVFRFAAIGENDPGHARQSAAVRADALAQMSALFPGTSWNVTQRPDGCPSLKGMHPGGAAFGWPLAFTHHGRYIGWASRIPPRFYNLQESVAATSLGAMGLMLSSSCA